MLESLRKSTGGWIAKIFIGLLAISFAIWGVGDMFRGASPTELARVGDVKIETETFRQLYQDRLQQVSRQIGRGLTPDQARALGLDRQLLGEVISETTLDVKARDLGLNISDQALLARIHENEAFRGLGGNFDPNRFYEVLRNAGFTEERYVDSERRLMLRQQMGRALGGDPATPAVLRDALQRYENERRSVEFVVLTPELVTDIPQPSDAEIEAYFNENQSAFRAPEYRRLVVLPITPESLADGIQIPDEHVKQTYENIRDQLGQPERRDVEQVIVADAAEAASIAERLAGGMTFEQLVEERKLNPADVSLGLVSQRDILDRAVGDAVFKLEPGQVSQPIAGRFGTVFARVNKVEPGKQPAFEEIADTLRRDMAVQRARSVVLDRHDTIEDERAAGSHLGEIADKIGAKAVTLDAIDRSGRTPDGTRVEDVPGLSALLPEAFQIAVGVEADPVEINGGDGYVWFEVMEITPSRERTLDEVRDQVAERWRNDQIAARLAEQAATIRKQLDDGQEMAVAAFGAPVQTAQSVRRGASVDGLNRDALRGVFETAEGRSGVARADDGIAQIVYRVTAIETPSGDGPDPQRLAELSVGLQDDVLVQYVMHLQNRLGVRVNQEALRTVTGGSDGF